MFQTIDNLKETYNRVSWETKRAMSQEQTLLVEK